MSGFSIEIKPKVGGRYVGRIESLDSDGLKGWIFKTSDLKQNVKVAINLGIETMFIVSNKFYRPDVAKKFQLSELTRGGILIDFTKEESIVELNKAFVSLLSRDKDIEKLYDLNVSLNLPTDNNVNTCYYLRQEFVESKKFKDWVKFFFLDLEYIINLSSIKNISLVNHNQKGRENISLKIESNVTIDNNYKGDADEISLRVSTLDNYVDGLSNKVEHYYYNYKKNSFVKINLKKKTNKVTLSIVIISKTPSNINLLLDSMCVSEDYTVQIIICWNGRHLEFNKILTKSNLRLELLILKPYNFAKNNNTASLFATGEYILFINDDVILDNNAIDLALRAFKNSSVGIVGINLRYPNDKLQHAGVFFNDDLKPFHRLKQSVRYDDIEVINSCFVPAVTGAFMMMRTDEFLNLKFDERFRVAGEDIALCLNYRHRYNREILYLAESKAIHVENVTRKKNNTTTTPDFDLGLIRYFCNFEKNNTKVTEVSPIYVNIYTEDDDWILKRKSIELANRINNTSINNINTNSEIDYYINYGYFRRNNNNAIKIANFTHYDKNKNHQKFITVSKNVDHCTAVSNLTADKLIELGVPKDNISVILVGADKTFFPKLIIGISGRVYPDGRKGEAIIEKLLEDKNLTEVVQFVANNDGWGIPIWKFENAVDFYRAIDYLLVPSLIEGGPVPFMEALAVGRLAIAPEIGVIPMFPHISYPVGNVMVLKEIIYNLATKYIQDLKPLSDLMRGLNWDSWAFKHELLFRNLILDKGKRSVLVTSL